MSREDLRGHGHEVVDHVDEHGGGREAHEQAHLHHRRRRHPPAPRQGGVAQDALQLPARRLAAVPVPAARRWPARRRRRQTQQRALQLALPHRRRIDPAAAGRRRWCWRRASSLVGSSWDDGGDDDESSAGWIAACDACACVCVRAARSLYKGDGRAGGEEAQIGLHGNGSCRGAAGLVPGTERNGNVQCMHRWVTRGESLVSGVCVRAHGGTTRQLALAAAQPYIQPNTVDGPHTHSLDLSVGQCRHRCTHMQSVHSIGSVSSCGDRLSKLPLCVHCST